MGLTAEQAVVGSMLGLTLVRELGFRNLGNFCLRNPESGGKCACEMWNPGLWNPEYSLRNPDSH